MRLTSSLFVSAIFASALVAGCEDPAANAPKATVGSAKPVAAASSAAPAKASAAANASAAPSAAAPAGDAVVYPIDATASKVEFVGSKVTGKHEGKFEKFSGSITVTGGKAETAKIAVEIDAASLKTDSEKLDGHLKSADFFEVEKFPKASFTSTEIKIEGEKATITGNLNLHGVEKSISFPATVKLDATSVSATAEFSINRKDFGLVYAGKPDDLIRDEVLIKLTVAGKRG
jgi:polyisoprenoid-binding protein YceI